MIKPLAFSTTSTIQNPPEKTLTSVNFHLPVHDVIGLLQNGETVDSVVRQLQDLTRAQVYECLACYEDHLAEIDYLVARHMAEADVAK